MAIEILYYVGIGALFGFMFGLWKPARIVFLESFKHPLESSDIDVKEGNIKVARH